MVTQCNVKSTGQNNPAGFGSPGAEFRAEAGQLIGAGAGTLRSLHETATETERPGYFGLAGRMMKGTGPQRRSSLLSTIWLARHSEVHNPKRIYTGVCPG